MKLHVRTATGLLHTGRIFTIDVYGALQQQVSTLKRMIESESGIPAKYQKLIYRGKLLEGMVDFHNDCHFIDVAPSGGKEAAQAFVLATTRAAVSSQDAATSTEQNRTIIIFIKWSIGANSWEKSEVNLSMAVKDLLAEIPDRLASRDIHGNKTTPFPWDVDLIYNGTCLQKGFVLSDYNISENSRLYAVPPRYNKGIGSTIARRNGKERLERVVRPLLVSFENLPLSLYPKALVKVTMNDPSLMFLALEKTLAPTLVASRANGAKRQRLCSNSAREK